MGNPLTTAYAGHADITEANVKALLDQFLPQDPPEGDGLGLVFIPERIIRAQKGLKTTVSWLETELGGPDNTIPVADLVAEMLARKEKTGDDLLLFLLFDPENESDVELANAANDAGIPIRNLAAAGDFLEFEEPEPEVPEAAAEPETPPWEEPAEVAAAEARSEALASALATATAEAAGVSVTFTLSPAALDALALAIVTRMAGLGAAQVEAQARADILATAIPVPSPAAEHVDSERPAEPGGATEPFPGSVAVYYHADKGTTRKARGIPKDGEVKIYMTEADAERAFAVTAARPAK